MKSQILVALLASLAHASLIANETSSRLTLSNERLTASVDKFTGTIDTLILDSQNLLGSRDGRSRAGTGPYLDCHCVPSGFYTPGTSSPSYTLLNGTDSTGTTWGGITLSDTHEPTGQVFEQYWFLRDGETGLHVFSRMIYHNSTTPFLGGLGEFRTLFRPNSNLWTHLVTNPSQFAPLPRPNPATGGTTNFTKVQDATWFLTNPSDPYVQQESSYFTKYTFSDVWHHHKAHGLFADGSASPDGSVYGAWFVQSTHETYFGGPTHSDLTVDGIVYNYMVSGHHGAQVPNVTDGFDRTFGPGYFFFNHWEEGSVMEDLRKEAESFADVNFASEFYDSVAEVVPGYAPSQKRGAWEGKVSLPDGAEEAVAVLSVTGANYQDNAVDVGAYQYWADVDMESGEVNIPRVKAGLYRLTVYASGVFGQFEQDEIVVEAGMTTTTEVGWTQESNGIELWRVGRPDKSSGEYRHGYAKDPVHALHPAEHRIYWGAYDFTLDFPDGVRFEVGKDDVAKDLNYVHWSASGKPGHLNKPNQSYGDGKVNNWTLLYDVEGVNLLNRTHGVFTVQLAGAATAAGNTNAYNASQPYSNLPYTVSVNGQDLEPWIIPYYQSSSCAVRSAVVCYNLSHKFHFEIKLLKQGRNEFVLSMPDTAKDHNSAVLPNLVYVQYDALRLEVA